MIELVVVGIGLLAVLASSEIVLGGRKLQTGLARLVAVWGFVGLALLVLVATRRGAGSIVFAIFWAGAFLTWFGVRSHVESSILLRMIHLLGQKSMPGADLVEAYEARYGLDQRIDELVRSGLVEGDSGRMRTTAKGAGIVAAVARLKGASGPYPIGRSRPAS